MEGLGRNAGPTWGEQVGGGERVGREVWRPAAKGPSVTLVISLLGGKTVPVGFPETRSSLTLALAPTAVFREYAFPVFPKGRSVWPG